MLRKPYLAALVLRDTGLWNFMTVGNFFTKTMCFADATN